MRVVITAAAEADLERIGDFVARDHPRRAVTFIDELVECCERIADAPLAFPLMPRFAHAGIRRRAYRSYLIFYRSTDYRIEVLHVLNGAQDFESIILADEA